MLLQFAKRELMEMRFNSVNFSEEEILFAHKPELGAI
jgi:hypothetical protein